MHITRRALLTTVGGIAAAATLTSCAGTGGSSAGGGDPKNIRFMSNHPGKSQALEQKIIDAFVAENPEYSVELIDGGSDYEELAQKFNAQLAGGDVPDIVVASDVTWFPLALNEAITPMDELWSSGKVDSDDYVDTLREDYVFEGKHYGLPYSRSTPLFYFNSELWEKAGLDGAPTTWDEFDEMAAKLLKDNPDVAPLVVPDGSNYLDWYFQGMIWTFGGSYSKEWDMAFTDDKSLEAGRFLAEQVNKGHIKITADPTNEFGTGLAGALLESTGSLGGLKEQAAIEFDTAYLPGPKPGCPTGGAGLAITNKIDDERKASAMKFVEFATNQDNTVTFSQATGYMPVRKSALEHPDEQAYLKDEPRAQTAIDQLAENTQSQDYARCFLPGGGDRIGEGLDRITTGGEDVEKIFEELQKQSQEVYERDIEPKL